MRSSRPVQHTIAGVDPVAFFRDHSDRCSAVHLKDTHDVDRTDQYKTPPDPELMAPDVTRWFYEMGTEGGLVDFPALMREIVLSGYDGWLTIEHDKAELGGGSYAESTCISRWYTDTVLAEAHAAAVAELEAGR